MKKFLQNRRLMAPFFLFLFALLFNQYSVQAQLVTGIDSLQKIDGQWQYYDFTSAKAFSLADTATYTPDIWGSSNEGVNFGKEFSSLIPNRRILLLGTGSIDTVTSVPTWTDAAPWVDTSWDFTHGTQGQPISPDQLWVVYTSEGLYAVMQIDELPDGNFGDSFTFKYKYMSEGGTSLDESNLNEEVGEQIAGDTTSTNGTGFDISSETIGELEDAGNYAPDFVFVSNEGVNFGNEGSTSLSSTGRRFILLGTGNLDTLATVPTHSDAAPWVSVSYDFADGTGGQPISVGQLWGVYTREGTYAAIEITALPGGNFGQSFDFKYKYQPNGSTSFDADTTIIETEYSIAIQSGNNQTITTNQSIPENMVVLVTDTDGNPAVDQTVAFSFSSIPDGSTGQGGLSSSVTTDANGLANSDAIVGNVAGLYQVRAQLSEDTETFVTFTITAEEPSGPQPATLVITGGNNQTTVLGDTIANPFELVVIDDIGEPMNGITVTFEEYQIPDGAVSGSFFTLDGIALNQSVTSNNRAYMNYTPGDVEGNYVIKAFLANYPAVDSVAFTVTGELLSTPQNFMVEAGIEKVELSWDEVEGAVEYQIYRALNDDNPASAMLLATVADLSFLDDEVAGDETYFYQLYSVDVFGNQSASAAGPLSATPSSNQVGEVVNGSATSTFGTGFDFSLQQTGDNEDEGEYQLDFAFVSNEGVNFGNESSSSLSETGRRFLLLGEGSLETINEVPVRVDENPWVTVSYDFADGTGGLPIAVGQLWGVFTREGHYAAMEITGLPEGNFGNSFTFDYKYQPSGTRFFDGDTTVVVEPDSMYSISIVDGDSQKVAPLEFSSTLLQVLVLDKNEEVVNGENVTFQFTQQPEDITESGIVSEVATTNAQGIAAAQVSGGDADGIYKVEARLSSDTTKFATFTLFVESPDTSSGEIISGSSTGVNGRGFDFSREEINGNEDNGDYQLDFAFVANEGVNFGNEGSTSLANTGRRFLLLGEGSLDTLNTLPERMDATPWVSVSYDFADGTGGLPIAVGQLWGVYTREGNYAAMEITDLPEGDFGNTFTFDYKYQPNGSRFFNGDTSVVVKPDLEYFISIASGDSQTVDISETASEFLNVLVVDENDHPVEGEEVAFSFSQQPTNIGVSGMVTSKTVTDTLGIAWALVTSGNAPGDYKIQATLTSDTTKFVTFSLFVEEQDTSGSGTLTGSITSRTGTGFDFSINEVSDNEDFGNYALDFAFVANEGVNFGNEGSTSLSNTGRRFLLLGQGSLDTLRSVPIRMDAAPWVTVSYDFADGTGGLPISVGQLWAVYTREGHYAAMEITALPDGDFGNSFDFDYKYQPSGSRFFESDSTTVSTEGFDTLPNSMKLSQNYPNPFNPATKIEYSLNTDTIVLLEVFDIQGRLVRTLVNQKQTSGAYNVTFDAQNLSSGVYIYRLNVGSTTFTKKMLLIK